MSYSFESLEPTQVGLEIDETLRARAWQESRAFATAASRWNAYLNQLCLQTVLAWLREEYDPQAAVFPHRAALTSYWEVVNGAAIAFAGRRLILIPCEAIEVDELRVPQEWVDIPSWVGDYYGAIQVNEDEGWVQFKGFVTHRQLKERGQYEWNDRVYCVDQSDLIADFGALWVSRQLAPQEITQVATPAIAPLPTTMQANHLIERLGHPAVVMPRLAIPFEPWAALMAHGGWRQKIAERRRGLPEQRSLLQWLQTGVSTLAQQAGWGQVEFQQAAGARGEASGLGRALSRPLTIADQPYELLVSPVAAEEAEPHAWRFTLRSLAAGGLIPAGFVLRLLTEDLQPFEGNEDIATAAVESLFIEVALEPGEGIVWEITPLPEAYEQEILR
ncbi:MAG TPA: DUF1822 family protein [Coleofasciculaceae cyanobacterium]